jgi:hypothetical protein
MIMTVRSVFEVTSIIDVEEQWVYKSREAVSLPIIGLGAKDTPYLGYDETNMSIFKSTSRTN